MHPSLQHLHTIAQKEERIILGLMSGTSLDGLDMALVKVKGHGTATQVECMTFDSISYTATQQKAIRSVFSLRQIDLQDLCVLNRQIALWHSTSIREFFVKNHIDRSSIDLIASHGQTIFHHPVNQHHDPHLGSSTLQIGDGDHLAVETGIITISDFRQKHIAAGGEGAPLVPYGDALLFGHPQEIRVLLNIGGISNITVLDPRKNQVFFSDVGPGNTLIDAFVRTHYSDMNYDSDGQLAAQGSVCQPLLQQLLSHPFFALPFPKSTGPELFNLHDLQSYLSQYSLSNKDILATLTAYTAEAIKLAIQGYTQPAQKLEVYVSGGGVHNATLMHHLKHLDHHWKIETTAHLGMNPDAKEAILFAVLANETIAGDYRIFEQFGLQSLSLGKISFPI